MKDRKVENSLSHNLLRGKETVFYAETRSTYQDQMDCLSRMGRGILGATTAGRSATTAAARACRAFAVAVLSVILI